MVSDSWETEVEDYTAPVEHNTAPVEHNAGSNVKFPDSWDTEWEGFLTVGRLKWNGF